MANKAFVAKNGLTVNTASVIMSQLSGTLTQASGGENLTLDENGQLGTCLLYTSPSPRDRG